MKKIFYFLLIHLLLSAGVVAQAQVADAADELGAKSTDKGDRMEFKVTTLNAEWLGCPSNGPSDESLQMRNVAAVIKAVNPDIIALQEVTMNPVKSLDSVLKHLGDEWGGHIVPWSAGSCAQSQGIIYKKASISLTGSSLVKNGGTSNVWSSGRYPVLYEVNFLSGEGVIPVSIINIHAKAYSDKSSYDRRTTASTSLKTLLDGAAYKYKNVIVIGDYNDYLESSQCVRYGNCSESSPSPYKNFVDDAASYRALTSSFTTNIDHIIISNELFTNVSSNATRETSATNSVPNYRNTTSDHTPVSITLSFSKEYTAAEKNEYSQSITLYPNPVQHTLNVESNTGDIAAVKIASMSGVVVYEQKNINAPAMSIQTSTWPTGTYAVTITSTKGEVGSKLMMKNQ
ncbi:MAG: T9SS type A sorting domain-containing protein [Prevotellaceae bacterium]|jgi:endonuclease/exonuclease/phosphatase family metal-dependent hydrolase|nr:T9SS type A sorting domain-containing protein [Prevotellaceae bacterium]